VPEGERKTHPPLHPGRKRNVNNVANPAPSVFPDRAAVMPLPGAVLLPHALLPLFIFEERYRAMLATVLASDRMFCVAQYRAGVAEVIRDDDMHAVAGLGFVRACVGHTDGTLHLILQGIARVRLEGFDQSAPYRIARIRVLEPESIPESLESRLRGELVALVERLPQFGLALPAPIRAALGGGVGLGILSDLVAGSLVADPGLRQQFLEQAGVVERATTLIRLLGGGGEGG
jgi:Lon protease-like protein